MQELPQVSEVKALERGAVEPTDFEEIVSEHYESLYRFAFSLTRIEADACDLTQQAFYVWASKGDQLRDTSKVKSWLFTTLRRAFLEGFRRRQRFPHCTLDGVQPEELSMLAYESCDTADHGHVLGALDQVDELYKAPVALFYLEDCSYLEIGKILQVPIGTVKSRMSRGLEQLRQILMPDPPRAAVF